MDHTQARVRARDVAFDRLNELTTWIAAASMAAVGVFAVIAAETIPGKASPSFSSNPSTASAAVPSPSSQPVLRHHRDANNPSNPSGVSSSAGPPMVATGASH